MQAHFSIFGVLAAQVGLYMNRDKTVLILAEVKSKQTLGIAHQTAPHNRKVDPFVINHNDNQVVKSVESEYYLGSRITRTGSALPEIKHRIGLGHNRADNLICLWMGYRNQSKAQNRVSR